MFLIQSYDNEINYRQQIETLKVYLPTLTIKEIHPRTEC